MMGRASRMTRSAVFWMMVSLMVVRSAPREPVPDVGGGVESECLGDDEGDRFGLDFFDASTDRFGEEFRLVRGHVLVLRCTLSSTSGCGGRHRAWAKVGGRHDGCRASDREDCDGFLGLAVSPRIGLSNVFGRGA